MLDASRASSPTRRLGPGLRRRSPPGRSGAAISSSASATATASSSTASIDRPAVAAGMGPAAAALHRGQGAAAAHGARPAARPADAARSRKPLMESLEKQAFEQFTESNQTADRRSHAGRDALAGDVPEDRDHGSKTLRSTFAGVSSLPNEGPAWIEGALGHALERAAGTLLRLTPPFVLMTLRGKIYLRLRAEQRRRDRRRRGAGPVRDRGQRGAARRPLARRRAGHLAADQLHRLAVAGAAGQAARLIRRRRGDTPLRRRACPAPSWRSRCGAPRPGRRRSAACARCA